MLDFVLSFQLSGYRPEFSRSEVGAVNCSRSGLPTLGVPPISIPKSQSISSHSSKEIRGAADTHPTFHRPFEISGGTKARPSGSSGGGSTSGGGMMPTINGYDRDIYEQERKLLAEREKMLAEHRASQEKAHQLRTGSGSSHGNSSSGTGNHGDNNNSSKERSSYSVGDKSRSLGDRELKGSSGHSSSHSSEGSSSKHSVYRSPHKSLLPSTCGGSDSAGSKSHSHLYQHPYPPHGKDSNKDHLPSGMPTKHSSHHQPPSHGLHGDSNKPSPYTSALTNLQNFSNSKVSMGFGKTLHSEMASSDDVRKNGSVTPRINGAYPSNSHSRVSQASGVTDHHPMVSPPTSGDRKKETSASHAASQHQFSQQPHRPAGQNRLNNVRSPKKIRQLLGGPTLAKDKAGKHVLLFL